MLSLRSLWEGEICHIDLARSFILIDQNDDLEVFVCPILPIENVSFEQGADNQLFIYKSLMDNLVF